jgi:hypothetical protein
MRNLYRFHSLAATPKTRQCIGRIALPAGDRQK